MQINITNFMGVASAHIDTARHNIGDAKAVALCGRNGNGKTSVITACRLAITGTALTPRTAKAIKFMDCPDEQEPLVVFDDKYHWHATGTGINSDDGAGFCPSVAAGIDRLSTLSPDARLAIILACANKPQYESVEVWLAANAKYREFADDISAALPPADTPAEQLPLRLAATYISALDNARQYKREWQSITGENYGGIKAANYQTPPNAEVLTTLEKTIKGGYTATCPHEKCGGIITINPDGGITIPGKRAAKKHAFNNGDVMPVEEWQKAKSEYDNAQRAQKAAAAYRAVLICQAIAAAANPATGIAAANIDAAIESANKAFDIIGNKMRLPQRYRLTLDETGNATLGAIPVAFVSRAERWIADAIFQLWAAKRHNAAAILLDDADFLSANHATDIISGIANIAAVWQMPLVIAGAGISAHFDNSDGNIALIYDVQAQHKGQKTDTLSTNKEKIL